MTPTSHNQLIQFSFKDTPSKALKVSLTKDKPTRYVERKEGRELLLAIGERKEISKRKLFLIARQIISAAKNSQMSQVSIDFEDFKFKHLKIGDEELGELLAVNMEMANFQFVDYKTKPNDGWGFIQSICVANASSHAQLGFSKGQAIGEQINSCRLLANTPGGNMTPGIFALKVKQMAKGTKVRAKILDIDDIKILEMGGVLGVARGSIEEPKFIVLEYYGTNKKDKPYVLVGKGVTFDSGGLSLKPSEHMIDMHHDMAGGSAAVHTIFAAERLGIKKNIVALIPVVENMPSGSSYHPGDVLRTMSGATIEVLNTDAEGRVILADALTYAKKYDPALVIDIATLTGAAAGALGQRASAIFSKDEKISKQLQDAGEETGDFLWPLPLWDEYEEEIKGTFGDWLNIGKTRYGGAITAAIFLYQWAKDYPWVHLDIAPTMTAIDGQHLSKGATGVPIKALIRFLETV